MKHNPGFLALAGGIKGWRAAGYEIERGRGD
jgi:hypothetical protein